MAANLRNDDGTVNLDGVKAHLSHVKGKYAQNAKNYEANTGKKMNFDGQAEKEQSGKGEGQEQQQKAAKDASETSK